MVHWSIGLLVHWYVGPLVHETIGPLVECQMLNVNKVKLLSERTSGVPPIIFQVRYDFRNMEQMESSLDALERLMAVPSGISLEEEVEESIDSNSKLLTKGSAGGTPKRNNSHEAVLQFR